MIKPQINRLEKEEGLKALEALKAECCAADCTYSKVTDIDDHEVEVPAIVMRAPLGDKEGYVGRGVTITWKSMNVNIFESHLFLYLQFERMGELIFDVTMDEPEMSKWLKRVIELGVIIICDSFGGFDIGVTNIPIDIPVMHLYLQEIRAAEARAKVGG